MDNNPALIVASSKSSNNGNTTNDETDDKGDDDEDDDKDDNITTNDINRNTSVGSTGTISTLTTTTNTDTDTNNHNNNRGMMDNDADTDCCQRRRRQQYGCCQHNGQQHQCCNTTRNSNTRSFEVGDGDGGASYGEGSIANAFLMGDDKNDAPDNDDADADANDDVDVHTRLQDVFYCKDGTAVQQAVSFPKEPKDFTPPAAKSALGEPLWSTVGNPGMWDQYCFRLKFNWKKEGKWIKRKFNDWDFYYTGWISGDNEPAYSRRHVLPSMVESELLFPSERKGLLNMRKLKLHSLTKERLILGDALFFYQLLLPLHLDPVDEAEDNPPSKRKPFYSEVSRWSSNYANHDHTGKGHYAGRITLKDVVRFDGIVFLHRVLDGRKENIGYRWVHSDALYSHKVAQTMSWYCWHQIKAKLKLNCNLEARVQMVECKHNMSTFNYAYKFDYIYEALVHNTRYFTGKAGDDLCMDESLWPYYGFGVPMLWNRPPHLTVDNFFNGDCILDWMVARNKLPKGVSHKYFHKESASQSGKKIAGVAQMCNPVTLVKEVPAKAEAALSIATAYDVYKELTDGTHGPTWSIEKSVDYQVFRQKLAEHMLHYDPKNQLYPADVLLHENTQMSKCQRSRADRRRCCSYKADHGGLVLNYHSLGTVFEFKGAGRFCFSSIEMGRHLGSFKGTKWRSASRLCYACGKPCYYMCSKCKDGKFEVALCSVKEGWYLMFPAVPQSHVLWFVER
eukprot:jgi/Psemu1/19794/gm1.19794_g